MEKVTGKAGLGKVIAIDEAQVEAHVGELVRGSVEATLNSLLDAEAERLCNARRYERTEGRRDTRAGHYERSLHTKAGPVAHEAAVMPPLWKSISSPFVPMSAMSVAATGSSGRTAAGWSSRSTSSIAGVSRR